MQQLHFFISQRSRHLLLFLTVLALYGASCNVLKSDLTVRAGKHFILGGNQNGAFTVKLQNKGPVPVGIAELKTNGQSVSRGFFDAEATGTLNFAAGSAAVIENKSDKPARLFLIDTGDKNVGMQEQ